MGIHVPGLLKPFLSGATVPLADFSFLKIKLILYTMLYCPLILYFRQRHQYFSCLVVISVLITFQVLSQTYVFRLITNLSFFRWIPLLLFIFNLFMK